jgi:branched-subunit amino acid transport protein
MRPELLLLFLAVGMGNYLMRFLPLLLALRRGETEPGEPKDATGGLGGLLTFVRPSVLVALLVTSVLPGAGNGGS